MTRTDAGCAAATFVLCAAVAAAWSGCMECHDCNCPETPEQPPSTQLLPIRTVVANGDGGTVNVGPLDGGIDAGAPTAPIPRVAPESGSVQVTGDQVIITYRQQGQDHRVVYAVQGPTY